MENKFKEKDSNVNFPIGKDLSINFLKNDSGI